MSKGARVRLVWSDGKSVQPVAVTRLNSFQLLGEQVLRRHISLGSPMDKGEVLRRDKFTVSPLRDTGLGYSDGITKLLLGSELADRPSNGTSGSFGHARQISGASFPGQQRRLWNSNVESIRFPNMATDPHKKAKMSPADKEAHLRLRALWDAIPKKKRPRQEKIGLGTQSNVSQYLTGRIPLNYYAVTVFSRVLGCKPEDIRSDLPEQQVMKDHSRSSDADLDKLWATYTREQKLLAIGLHQAFTGQIENPVIERKQEREQGSNDRRSRA
jgi:hypothetical protein